MRFRVYRNKEKGKGGGDEDPTYGRDLCRADGLNRGPADTFHLMDVHPSSFIGIEPKLIRALTIFD